MPLKTAQTLAGPSEQIDRVEIVLCSGADVDVEQAKSGLAQQLGADLVVVRAEAAIGTFSTAVFVQGGLVIVGIIILFAAGFVILNAFAMSVTARTREIGALRSLGMTRRQVLRSVLMEAGLLGLSGAILVCWLGLRWPGS